MDKCAVLSFVANSGISSPWNLKDVYLCAIFSRGCDEARDTLQKTHILYTSFFWRVYHVIVLDGEWIHGTLRGEDVCDVLILVEDRRGLQSLGQ